MFTRILLVIVFYANGLLKAQNNLILLTENGENFWLYVNDQKVNDSAQSIVKASKIWDDTCKVKIVYANKNFTDFSAKAYLLQNGRSCKDLEFTYSVEKVKGKYILKYVSTNLIVIDSTLTPKLVSARVKDFAFSQKKEQDAKNRLAEVYPAPTPCTNPINDSLLQIEIKKLKDNHIEINRVKDGKWLISNNCFTVIQFEKILTAFDYDDSKLRLSKFGYDYIIDKANFLNLIPSFYHKTEKEELKTFFSTKTQK